jgi:hypothetical protein
MYNRIKLLIYIDFIIFVSFFFRYPEFFIFPRRAIFRKIQDNQEKKVYIKRMNTILDNQEQKR